MKKALLSHKRESVFIILALLSLVISAALSLAKVYNNTPFALLDAGLLCAAIGFLLVWKKAVTELSNKRFEEGCFSLLAFFVCISFAALYAFLPAFSGKTNYFPFLATVPLFFFLLDGYWNDVYISLMTEKTGKTLSLSTMAESVDLALRPLTGNGEISQEVAALKKPFFPLFPLAALLLLFIFLGNGLTEAAMLRCAALFASVPPLLTFFAHKPYLTLQLRAVNKGFLLFDGALEKAEKVNLSVLTVETALSEGNLRVERVYTKNVPEKDILLMASSFYGYEDAISKALSAALTSAPLVADERTKHSEKDAFFIRCDGKNYTLARSYDIDSLGLSCSDGWLNTLPKTKTLLALAEENTVIGFVALTDNLRPSAQTALEKLNSFTETYLLTQESSYIAKTTAKQLGIKNYKGELSLSQINEELENLALEGGFILHTALLPESITGAGFSVNTMGGSGEKWENSESGESGESGAFDAVLLESDLNLLPEMLNYSKKAIFKLKLLPLIRLALAAALSAACLSGAVAPPIGAVIGLFSALVLKIFH